MDETAIKRAAKGKASLYVSLDPSKGHSDLFESLLGYNNRTLNVVLSLLTLSISALAVIVMQWMEWYDAGITWPGNNYGGVLVLVLAGASAILAYRFYCTVKRYQMPEDLISGVLSSAAGGRDYTWLTEAPEGIKALMMASMDKATIYAEKGWRDDWLSLQLVRATVLIGTLSLAVNTPSTHLFLGAAVFLMMACSMLFLVQADYGLLVDRRRLKMWREMRKDLHQDDKGLKVLWTERSGRDLIVYGATR